MPQIERIVAFDLDFFQLRQEFPKEDLKKMFTLLNEISLYNHLFFFTNNPCDLAVEIIKEWKLSLGYLIVNSGACIYDISSRKTIYENFLSSFISEAILRFIFTRNLNFVVYTSQNIPFSYGINYINSSDYRGLSYQYKLSFSKYKKLKNWKDIKNLLKDYSIYSIEVLFNESSENLRNKKISSFLASLHNFDFEFSYFITNSSVFCFAGDNFKFQSIEKVLSISEDLISKNLVYCSLSLPDWEIASKSSFWLSDLRFAEIIEKKMDDNQVIYVEKNPRIWSEWWNENDYMWRENINNFGWISTKIKSLDLSKTEGKGKDFKNNCYELNLQTGALSSRILNDKGKRKEWKRNSLDEDKSISVLLFLWPEQIQNIFNYQNK